MLRTTLLITLALVAGCAGAPADTPTPAADPPVAASPPAIDPTPATAPSPRPTSAASPTPTSVATPSPVPTPTPTPTSPTPVAPFVESRENCTFDLSGTNPWWPLQLGRALRLAGEDDGEPVELTITTTGETKLVDGIVTRVVIEEEVEDGELVERSWNYLAACRETQSVWYFGEDVDIYEDGRLASHEGAWLAGVGGARAGILMPGAPAVGLEHDQEVAPGIAEDHAKVVAFGDVVETPAGTFTDTMRVEESTPLEPGHVEQKWYARGVGLLVDADLKLVEILE